MISLSHWGLFPCPVWVTAEWDANRYDYEAVTVLMGDRRIEKTPIQVSVPADVDPFANYRAALSWPKPAERPYKPTFGWQPSRLEFGDTTVNYCYDAKYIHGSTNH